MKISKLKKEEIQQFLNGDDSIFPLIFATYHNKINYLAIDILRNQADCDEVIQNTFVKIISNRKNLHDARAFNSWIYRIAYNECMDIYRSNKRGSAGIDDADILEKSSNNDENPDNLVRKKEILETVKKEINELPENMRQVCLLRFVGECSIEEISEIMEIPSGTVKSRLNRARIKLKQELSLKKVTPATYLSVAFTPMLSQVFKAFVKQQQISSMSKATISGAIKKAAGINTEMIVTGSGAVFGIGSVLIGASTVLVTFGVYTVANPIPLTAEAQISEVSYLKEETNENLQVVINFTEKVNSSDINITNLDKQEDISTEAVDTKNYMFIVKENGTYRIQYGNVQHEIKIDNIDKESPQLTQIKDDDGILRFTMHDNLTGIDFDKSYVKKGDHTLSLKKVDETSAYLEAEIKENSSLYLYDKVGNYQVYEINVKENKK